MGSADRGEAVRQEKMTQKSIFGGDFPARFLLEMSINWAAYIIVTEAT